MQSGATWQNTTAPGRTQNEQPHATPIGTGPCLARSGRCGAPTRGTRQHVLALCAFTRIANNPPRSLRKNTPPAGPVPPVGTRAGRAGPRLGPEVQACHTLTARSRTSSCRGTRPRPRYQPRGPFPPSQRVSVYILSLVDFYSKSNPETKTGHLLTVKQRKRNPIPKTSRFREVVVVPESIGGGQNAKVEPL
jgi:hypothetical protein